MYAIGTVFEVQESFYKHVGVYVGGDRVLHNDRQRGEEVVTFAQFLNGRSYTVRHGGLTDTMNFLQRVQQVLAKPNSYDFLFNNCEHTVYRVRSGVASSPQLASFGLLALVVGAGVALARAR
jgi:hypothetical protein